MKLRNVFRAIKLTWNFNKKYIIIKTLLLIVSTAASFATLNITKNLIDLLTSQNPDLKIGIALSVILFGIAALLLSIQLFQSQYFPIINLKLNYSLQENLIDIVSKVDYCNFDNPEFYDEMERALNESAGLTKCLDSMYSIFSSSINLLTTIILFIRYNYIIPLLLLMFAAPYWVIKSKLNKYTYDISKKIASIGRKNSALKHLLTSKYYAHEVRSFNLNDFLLTKYKDFANSRIHLTKESNKKKNKYSFFLSLLQAFITLISSIILICYVIIKHFTIGTYTLLQSYVAKMQASLSSLLDCLLKISENDLYLDNLFSFIDKATAAIKSKGIMELPQASSHKIEFRDVSFKYPSNDKIILDHISVTINPGEVVMLVGENGAGKSTLLLLLNAFYDNYDGEILIDDINIKDLSPESIRKNISMMFQSGNLLPLTLKENLVFDGDIQDNAFVKFPWFQSLISKFPNGLNTILLTYMYPNGIQPSGGETQKIKLMRAILKDASGVIVMDEPSNALDPETEYQVLSTIKEIAQRKTAIIVSHKLSAAIYADKIIHLKNGKIIEYGSHEELMSKKGEYAHLFNLQAEKYIESYMEKSNGL